MLLMLSWTMGVTSIVPAEGWLVLEGRSLCDCVIQTRAGHPLPAAKITGGLNAWKAACPQELCEGAELGFEPVSSGSQAACPEHTTAASGELSLSWEGRVPSCQKFGERKRKKRKEKKSSHCGSGETNPTSIHEDTGSIPGLGQWVQ